MKEQEAKLRAKYPGLKPGGSSLLQKRLSKGVSIYMYNMFCMPKIFAHVVIMNVLRMSELNFLKYLLYVSYTYVYKLFIFVTIE